MLVIYKLILSKHWVVIKSKVGNTYYIDDPYYKSQDPSETLLSNYNNTFTEMRFYHGSKPPVSIPAGANVTADLGYGIGINFDNVTFPGDTSAQLIVDPQIANLVRTNSGCYDINTNAIFSGEISVSLHYDDSNIAVPESNLKLLHFENNIWVDVTSFVDTLNHEIFGRVSSLSPFVVAETVPLHPTSINLLSPINPSIFGQPVTFTVVVSSNGTYNPTGTVTFLDGGNSIASPISINGTGQVSLTTSTLSIGTHGISAIYSGDDHFAAISANMTQIVDPPPSITVNGITKVSPKYDFAVTINATSVTGLNTAQYDITFDNAVLRLDSVFDGLLNSTPEPVHYDSISTNGTLQTYHFINNSGSVSVNGSGTLATLYFHTLGSIGTSSNISISNGILTGMNGEIPADWVSSQVYVSIKPGDANGDDDINVVDMTKVSREILFLDSISPGADANLDGKVNVLDLTKIAHLILGLDSQ